MFKRIQFVKLWKNKKVLIHLFFIGTFVKVGSVSLAILGFITNSMICYLGMSLLFALSTLVDMALGERMAYFLE